MKQLLKEIEDEFKVSKFTDVHTGDTVKVFQKVIENDKERIQVFEGLVIATKRRQSKTFTITVRRIASGVGVEKTILVHSPNVQKIEVVKRSKVRRKNLIYMRNRSGKSARLTSLLFDKTVVNYVPSVDDKSDLPDEVIEAAKEVEEKMSEEEVKPVEVATTAEPSEVAVDEAAAEVPVEPKEDASEVADK